MRAMKLDRDATLWPGLHGPADDASLVVACGFVACDIQPSHPLINALPRSCTCARSRLVDHGEERRSNS